MGGSDVVDNLLKKGRRGFLCKLDMEDAYDHGVSCSHLGLVWVLGLDGANGLRLASPLHLSRPWLMEILQNFIGFQGPETG